MNWDDLKYVLAVSRARSFQGAGKLLRVTHTTVSRRIGAFEARLGASLFDRGATHCRPTQACQAILESARRIEAEIREIHEIAAETGGAPAGQVIINTMPWIIHEALIPALPAFRAAYPAVRLAFFGALQEHPASRTTPTISLRFDIQAAKGTPMRDLCDIGYAVYGPRGGAGWEAPWVSFGALGYALAPNNWLSSRGVTSEDVAVFGNDAAIVHAAIRAGAGKGLIPERLGDRDPALERLSGQEPELVRTLRAVLEADAQTRSEITVALRWIEDTFGRGCFGGRPATVHARSDGTT